ncbi:MULTISPECIES: AraC family transcriptional regulator [unclassified Neorhizobium]|uniref:helix-turn-helix domain-containing protein n=1 Tax=unclassified Neorhizobium TaxID=2629175 RepID=UPI001FF2E2D9|nr:MULTISPECIES: AraC family transcriptional regulator [unclassified Neorhizobium]MCJ9671023.1 AraC family transcriptional regulator [Neorhizobium sp. SHOUNA12B]MCJ9743363.1 AraC family transcriptional regulator [Neorhizobium sp. SHOUNA12A]
MLSVPLPFLAGLVFALTLYRSLKGVELPGTRRYFYAFLVLYAFQGVGVGLRFGYGVDGLVPFLPITASIMPPLAFLAFRGLTAKPLEQPWLHAVVPCVVAVAVGFFRDLVDPLLLVIFFGYGVALYRQTVSGGDDVMAEASLQRVRPALRAARLTAGLMLFFAISDAALAVYTNIYGARDVPVAVTIMNLTAMAVVIAYYFSPDFSSAKPTAASPSVEPTEEDKVALSRIEAALEEGELYKSEDLSLAKLSRKARLPAREASAVINRARGLNVSQFVNDRRIAEACRLLRETERTVIQVMLDVGFSTKSNFNREFRRVTGMSPKQWRAEARAAQDGGAIKTRP